MWKHTEQVLPFTYSSMRELSARGLHNLTPKAPELMAEQGMIMVVFFL